jgi:hypothetical protein
MANTLKFKRGLLAGLPTAAEGEPLFTTDSNDLYIGTSTGNQRFQKYIASGATTQILRGDGSLYTFPLAITSPSAGQVLKYNGTSWVNDSDSGITGSGSSGRVAFWTGASTQSSNINLFWDNTNSRLGIGTTTPSQLLHIFGGNMRIDGTAGGGASITLYPNTSNADARTWSLGASVNAFGDFGIKQSTAKDGDPISAGSFILYLSRLGNTLLGSTTDSGEKLQVTGTMKVTGATSIGGVLTTGAIVSSAVGGVGGQEGLRIYNNNAYISFFNSANTTRSAYVQGNTSDLTLATSLSTPILFYTNATEKMRLDASGNLLLGSTTSSGERLQVTGTAKITGNTTIGSTAFSVDTANTRVGIGTNVPSWALDIVTTGTSISRIRGGASNNQGAAYFVTQGGSNSTLLAIGDGSTMVGGAVNNAMIYVNGSPLTFNMGGTNRMSLETNGNFIVDGTVFFVDAVNNRVGMGTTTPTEMLHVSGNGIVTGNLTVDTNTLFVDATNNRVGVLTATPSYGLHVQGTGYFNDNVRFPNLKGVVFVQTGGSLLGSISMDSSDQVTIDNNGFFGLSVGTSYNLLGGNTGIGTSSFGTSATRTFAMLNGTAPSTSPTDIFQMYSNDITAGNAAPHFRTENGAVIKLYQETTAVGNAIVGAGGGSAMLDDDTFDGYTLRQIVRALRNQGILQ